MHQLSAAGAPNLNSNLSPEVERLKRHLKERAIRTDGPFTLRSGAVSSWYLDGRQTTFDGAGARLVAEAVIPFLADDIEAVGGMTMGADPIAVAVALIASDRGRPLNAFSIRKDAKAHGTGGRLVGPVAVGHRVAILEDTTSTTGAFMEAIDAAEAGGLVVVQALCLVDRSGGLAAEKMSARKIPYLALLTPQLLDLE